MELLIYSDLRSYTSSAESIYANKTINIQKSIMSDTDQSITVDALSRLRAFYSSLKPRERKVADFVLNNPSRVIRMTLADLAIQTGISEATIIRFSRSLGYPGYLDFKMALLVATHNSPLLIYDSIQESDTPQVIASSVFHSAKQSLEDTLAVIDFITFEQIIRMLCQAEHILIVGVGTSSPMVNELFNRLFRLRMNVQAQTDSYLQVMQASLLTPKDLLFVISQWGESLPPINSATVASKNGCPVVSIVGNTTSKIARLSDAFLLSVSNETSLEKTSSRIAQHAIIQALYVCLGIRSLEITNQAEQEIWRALDPYKHK